MKNKNIILELILVLLLAVNSYTAYTVFRINNEINMKNLPIEEDSLIEMNYYKDFNLDDEKYQFITDDTFLIYFRSNNCKFCEETDQLVLAYINKGYYQKIPIYFAEYENTPILYNEIFGVDSNPTMVLINNNQVVKRQEGVDSIFDLLDSIVYSSQ